LGHPFILSGKVVSGKQIGKQLGFPTANIEIEESHKLIPEIGIYAARIIHGERILNGMLYIGKRPSLKDDNSTSIEINIFDFSEIIYNEFIMVEILEFVREDKKFESLEELKAQLKMDKKIIQGLLKSL
ncbi:MAG: riboflavin kinase, partial [Bacteroidota bacterium]